MPFSCTSLTTSVVLTVALSSFSTSVSMSFFIPSLQTQDEAVAAVIHADRERRRLLADCLPAAAGRTANGESAGTLRRHRRRDRSPSTSGTASRMLIAISAASALSTGTTPVLERDGVLGDAGVDVAGEEALDGQQVDRGGLDDDERVAAPARRRRERDSGSRRRERSGAPPPPKSPPSPPPPEKRADAAAAAGAVCCCCGPLKISVIVWAASSATTFLSLMTLNRFSIAGVPTEYVRANSMMRSSASVSSLSKISWFPTTRMMIGFLSVLGSTIWAAMYL